MQLRESLLQLVDLRGTLNGVLAAVNIIRTNVLDLEADVNEIQSSVNEIQANVQTNQNVDVDVEQNAPTETGNFISVLKSGTVIVGFNCMHILVELMFYTML